MIILPNVHISVNKNYPPDCDKFVKSVVKSVNIMKYPDFLRF